MTTITIFRKSGRITGFRASGHSNFDAIGKDIVCAAASSITQSTVIGILHVAKLDPEITKDERTGHLELYLKESNDRAQTLLETMELALESLQEQYPKFIQVKGETQ